MAFYPDERLGLFIDGANFYNATRALNLDIDYKLLLEEFRKRGRLVRASYYTALIEDGDKFSPLKPLIDWLDYNGYNIITKPAKRYTDYAGNVRTKGDMDVDLTVDMLDAASYLDHAVLFSGDGDFAPLIRAVQRRGVRVSVVSTLKSSPPVTSDDLRRQADAFIELAELAKLIGRENSERTSYSEREEEYEEDGADA